MNVFVYVIISIYVVLPNNQNLLAVVGVTVVCRLSSLGGLCVCVCVPYMWLLCLYISLYYIVI